MFSACCGGSFIMEASSSHKRPCLTEASAGGNKRRALIDQPHFSSEDQERSVIIDQPRSVMRQLLPDLFSEDKARSVMRQLLQALVQEEAATRTHRGVISPDNILVCPNTGGPIKIHGFGGLSSSSSGDPQRAPAVLEMLYCSPDQLNHSCRRAKPADDVWALGCVMFEMLNGSPLFEPGQGEDEDAQEADVLEQTMYFGDEIISYGDEAFDHVPGLSQAGRELLAGMLAFWEDERFTAADALKHRWFTEEQPPAAAVGAESPGGFVA